jgi:NADH-quinone oxidoreductase subunit N
VTLDFSTPVQFLWALAPEAVLAVAAAAVLLADAFGGGRVRAALPAVTLAGLAAAGGANLWTLTLRDATGTGMVAVDAYRVFGTWLVLAGAALAVCVARDDLAGERAGHGEFHALVLFAALGMTAMTAARDLILLFLAFETMSVAAYVLAGFRRRDVRSAEAGLKYFLLGAFSSAFLLYGVALVYGAAGTTNLALARLALGPEPSPLGIAGLALLGVGFAFKVAAVPFHMWAPDVYEGAPTSVTAYMAATVKAAGFVALARVFAYGFGEWQPQWESWWRVLALATMVVPNLVALGQTNVKRMLAYSSVAHAGYLLVAIAAANRSGLAAFLFYLVAYTAMTVGAFALVLARAGARDGRLELADAAGLGWTRPWSAGLLALFLVSLAGFPPTAGFVAKVYVFRAAWEAGLPDLAIVLALTTVVSYWYYLRVVVEMYMREPAPAPAAPGDGPVPAAPAARSGLFRAALAVCAAATILAGVFPQRPLAWADRSVAPVVEPEIGTAAAGPAQGRVP